MSISLASLTILSVMVCHDLSLFADDFLSDGISLL